MSISAWIAALSLTVLILGSTFAGAQNATAGYQPAYTLGTGKDNWWVRYPDQNLNSDEPVGHPTWVLSALKAGPVMILDHTDYCRPCVKLQADVKRIMANISTAMTYFDLDAEGRDRRAQDALDIYSPTGLSENRVPLLVILTLIRDGDDLKVAWHSSTGLPVDSEGNDLGEAMVRSYLQDAIYYHSLNKNASIEDPDLFSGVREGPRMERLKKGIQNE